MLFAVLAEAIAISWIYGADRFCADIKDMIGFSPGLYWRVCWKFVAPIFIMVSDYHRRFIDIPNSFKKKKNKFLFIIIDIF